MRIRPVDAFGYAPGWRGGVPISTHIVPPAFTPRRSNPVDVDPGRRRSVRDVAEEVAALRDSAREISAQAARRVTAHDAAATVPATVKTAGQAPTFFASGCDPAKAAT